MADSTTNNQPTEEEVTVERAAATEQEEEERLRYLEFVQQAAAQALVLAAAAYAYAKQGAGRGVSPAADPSRLSPPPLINEQNPTVLHSSSSSSLEKKMAEHHQGRGAVPVHEQHDHNNGRAQQQQLCLDAGRVLMLLGLIVAVPTAFHPTDGGRGPAAAAAYAFIAFLFWILGVGLCLVGLTPPAAPWAVRAGTAVATTVFKCLLAPVK